MPGAGLFKKMLAKSSAGSLLGSKDLELAKYFRVVKKLGQGGYSSVYEVQRLSDKRHYALKVTSVQELSDAVAQEVVQEIRLLASLQNPYLVQYHEAFVDHDRLCIVTELMPGGDLSTALMIRYDRMQRFAEPMIWQMFLQIAVAVQYLHHNHIVHRDLKPQNVLVGADGTLKLADLGIAEILDRVFTRTASGTPHYMAPEFWRGAPCSYSADVWALGCVLHELCALRPLFLCRKQCDMEDKMLGGVWERIPKRYSAELQNLVDTLLTVDPAARPTMDEVMELPAVRAAAAQAPEPLRSRCASSGSTADDVVPRLLDAIRPPERAAAADAWDGLNDVLPPARYASGGSGVGDSLRAARRRRAMSTGDLRALGAAAARQGGNGRQSGGAASVAGGYSPGYGGGSSPRSASNGYGPPPASLSCRPAVYSVLGMARSSPHWLRRHSTESIPRNGSMGRVGSSQSLASTAGGQGVDGGVAGGSATDLSSLMRPLSRAHSASELDLRRALAEAGMTGHHIHNGSAGSLSSSHSGPRGSAGSLGGLVAGSAGGGGGFLSLGTTASGGHMPTATTAVAFASPGASPAGSTHGSGHYAAYAGLQAGGGSSSGMPWNSSSCSLADSAHGGVPLPSGSRPASAAAGSYGGGHLGAPALGALHTVNHYHAGHSGSGYAGGAHGAVHNPAGGQVRRGTPVQQPAGLVASQQHAMPDLGQLLGPAAQLGGMMAPQAGTRPLSQVLHSREGMPAAARPTAQHS